MTTPDIDTIVESILDHIHWKGVDLDADQWGDLLDRLQLPLEALRDSASHTVYAEPAGDGQLAD